jgi:hypothetical protein
MECGVMKNKKHVMVIPLLFIAAILLIVTPCIEAYQGDGWQTDNSGATGTGANVEDTVYGSGWNGDTTNAPSQNAVYDKVTTIDSWVDNGTGSYLAGNAGVTGDLTAIKDLTVRNVAATTTTASRAMITNAKNVAASSATTSTELGYVSGVTSAIQTQLNTKAPAASPTFTGIVTVNGSGADFRITTGTLQLHGDLSESGALTVVKTIRVGLGSGKAAYNAIDDDSTVGGTALLMNASNDLWVEGDFETGGAAIIGGNLTMTGELFNCDEPVALYIDPDLTVNTSYKFYAPLPYKTFTVNQIRLCASDTLSSNLTVSLYRNTTELTTTKLTRPMASNTAQAGAWITGLNYKFQDTDFVGIKVQGWANVADKVGKKGYVELIGTVSDRK